MGLVILGETAILLWFFTFDCFGHFLAKDGWFIDFINLGDSIALPWCICFYNSIGLGVS